jgi:hypothetical protein
MSLGRGLVLAAALLPAGVAGAQARAPARIWGVTVDRVQPLDAILEAVRALPRRMTVRVVLDDGVPPETYRDLIEGLAPGADVMAELADSYDFKTLDRPGMAEKTRRYLDAFGPQVAIWEVGNEVNGDWLGPEAEVVAKVTDAFDQVKARGGRTALTLYYWGGPDGLAPEIHMARWALAHLPARMLVGLDYVFVSYYEDYFPARHRPDWERVFHVLGRAFPDSLLGLGEVGALRDGNHEDRVRRYYGLRVDHPRYVGGCFWWTFATDMVPRARPMWRALADQLRDPGLSR